MHRRALRVWLFSCCAIAVTAGCTGLPDRNPLPESLSDKAEIPGITGARSWGDEDFPIAANFFEMSKEELQARFPADFGQPHNYLAISGGGPQGAFGAGLLNGWTDSGTRPEFTYVTGVSTGALMAPFAFLGPEYDYVLREVYTTYSTKDILELRSGPAALLGDAAADTEPLRQSIAKHMGQNVMEAIAAEYAKGRFLDIITTNLDAGRPVVWDIGRIAASGTPEALQLIRDVMLASAAIPAAFPPVMMKVVADGDFYDEMHVDGGATTMVYMGALSTNYRGVSERLEAKGNPNVFVIRNGWLTARWTTVERQTLSIAARTMESLFNSLSYGDIYRIFLETLRDDFNFHLAYIPEGFNMESKEFFDPEYMTALFNVGYEMARDGYEWQTSPPGYEEGTR